MASNGLVQYANRGKCRICQRQRKTDLHVKPVGEIHWGYATGHIWECVDRQDCIEKACKKIRNMNTRDYSIIKIALKKYTEYEAENEH